jgi:hypothetical protein
MSSKPKAIQEHIDKCLPLTKTVLILGAGASHGSSLAGNVKPPLIRNFFDCANKLGLLNKKGFKPIWHYLEKDGGIPFANILRLENERDVNIEQIYSLISGLDHDGDIKRLIERFFYEVLTATTKIYKKRTCEFHDILLKILRPELIVSFNYDLIIDRSLGALYPNWEEYQISKFKRVYNGNTFVRTEDYLSVYHEKNKEANNTILPLLFKLHGSLNHYYDITYFEMTRSRRRWDKIRTNYIVPLKYAFDAPRLYQKRALRDYAPSTIQTSTAEWAYDYKKAELNLDLIPPIWNKDNIRINDDVIQSLQKAKKLVFIGYSMSEIDLWALRMFRVSYKQHKHKKDLIVEVIGDKASYERVESIYYDSTVQNISATLAEYVHMLTI